MVTAAMKSEDVYFLAGKLCKPRQSVERQRYYSSNKVVKVMVFPVVTYSCESWTIKKAEGQKIDAFEL